MLFRSEPDSRNWGDNGMANMASIICAILGDRFSVALFYLEPWLAGVNAIYASLQKGCSGQATLNLGTLMSFISLSSIL